MKQGVAAGLRQLGCIKRAKAGEDWTLKSGLTSPVYVDLRTLPQYPRTLDQIAETIICANRFWNEESQPQFVDYFAGLPIGGVPLATILAQKTGIPQILIRKVAKAHGIGKMVEADYASWAQPRTVILVDDVFTTGSTVCETIAMLKEQQIPLIVKGVVCVVNRSQPNLSFVPGTSIPVFGLLNLYDLFPIRAPFEVRALQTQNKTAARLFEIMSKKKTNLCLSADFDCSRGDMIELFRQLCPHLAAVKIHHDLLPQSVVEQLISVAKQSDVLVMSDDKFADIGSIIGKKLVGHTAADSDLFTIHGFAGPGGIDELHGRAVLVAEMSNRDAMTDDPSFAEVYVAATQKLVRTRPTSVVGVVCQSRATCDLGDHYVYMTPGVNETTASDGKDQRYRSCHQAIAEQQNDLVIVGRGICQDTDPLAATIRYRDAAWQAYQIDGGSK